METEIYSSNSVNDHQPARSHILEDRNLYIHRRENLKFRVSLTLEEA